MLEMRKAWKHGISPYQFRKTAMDDLNFIFEMDKAERTINKKLKSKTDQDNKVKEAMQNLQRRGF